MLTSHQAHSHLPVWEGTRNTACVWCTCGQEGRTADILGVPAIICSEAGSSPRRKLKWASNVPWSLSLLPTIRCSRFCPVLIHPVPAQLLNQQRATPMEQVPVAGSFVLYPCTQPHSPSAGVQLLWLAMAFPVTTACLKKGKQSKGVNVLQLKLLFLSLWRKN